MVQMGCKVQSQTKVKEIGKIWGTTSRADDDSDNGRPSVIRFNEHENLRKKI